MADPVADVTPVIPVSPIAPAAPPAADSGVWDFLGWWSTNPWLHHAAAAVLALVILWGLWHAIYRALPLVIRRSAWLAQREFLLLRTAKWVYWVVAWIFVLQQAGVDTENLWTTLAAVGAMVAIGFIAVWSLLSNLVASVLIVATRLFKPNDDVEVIDVPGGNSVRGTVRSVDMMFTTLEETREDGTTSTLRVPNNLFFQKVIRIRGS